MLRVALFFLLVASVGLAQSAAQTQPKQVPAAPAPADAEQSIPQPVADAEAAIVKSDWKTAAATLNTWIAAHPTDARALFDSGYVADAQNRLPDAESFYQRAVQADPKSFEAQLSLGLLLARQGKLNEARPALAAATQLDPGSAGPALKARAWRALAQIDKPRSDGSGNATQASNDLLEALKLSPETPEDTLLAAQLAEAAGQYDAAEAAYRRLLAKDPKSIPASSGLAHILIRQKQYPEAEKLLRAALVQSPDDPGITAQLAGVLASEDNPDAIPLLQKLHAAHPADQNITRMLADMLADAGQAPQADQLYLQLLAANPNSADLLVAHGQELTRQLKYPEAYVAFDKATQLDPDNADGWSGLAFAASKTGHPDVTLHALTMRSKFLPEVPATYFLWATTYDTLRQKKQAVVYYHHFLDSAAGKFPDQEWQARQRLKLLER